jgi:hypothetical protein
MTATEWLIKQLIEQGYFDGNKPLSITNLEHLQHEAKELEKYQIKKAWINGSRGWKNFFTHFSNENDYYDYNYTE